MDTRIRRAEANRAWGRALPTRGNFAADGVSRAVCLCPSSLALRQDVPGITLSSVELKNPKNRSLGTMPQRGIVPMHLLDSLTRCTAKRRDLGAPTVKLTNARCGSPFQNSY